MVLSLSAIKKSVNNCRKCNLWKTRHSPVFGEGSVNTKIIFIGEAPGRNEDIQGRPFVGKAGKIFDELLHSISFERNDVYITNILKCRPPKNRNPYIKEIKTCTFYLNKQIDSIKPTIISPLGNFATSYIFDKFGLQKQRIGKIHGKIFRVKTSLFESFVIPLYHPAAAVYNPNIKNVLIKDFKSINKTIKTIKI